MNILFFIGRLNTGGTERQLSVLATGLAKRGHNVKVVTLYPGGKIAEELTNEPDIKLVSIWRKRSRFFGVRMLALILSPFSLRKHFRYSDCVYSMLEASNFIAWVATRFKKRVNLVWGIRSSHMEGHWKMALFDKICAYASSSVELLIPNSRAGLTALLDRGYKPKNCEVIPNGIDTSKFKYSKESSVKIRNELSIADTQLIVGMVGRINTMKDHPVFLKAASLITEELNNVTFMCIGSGDDVYTIKLQRIAENLGIQEKVLWLGDRSDVAEIYSAIDVLVSSSLGEGFSNVIGEAMSIGIPCVVTHVGDSAWIVGEFGIVVPIKDEQALAMRVVETLTSLEQGKINNSLIRNRVKSEFSVKSLLDRTEMALLEYEKG